MKPMNPAMTAAWEAGRAAFLSKHSAIVLGQVLNLAKLEFIEMSEGKTHDPRYGEAGPVLAELLLSQAAARFLRDLRSPDGRP